jgi:hypothetical protein
MIENVSDIIATRARQQEPLKTMVVWSVAAHIVMLGVVLVMPMFGAEEKPKLVMSISLGGAIGPKTGGLTQMGGRTVQATRTPEPIRRPDPPPAPVQPKMALPDPKSRPRPQAKPTQAPQEARSRALSTGEVPEAGSAKIETGARGQGFGLSSAGGGGVSGLQLDVTNFCCEEYLQEMVRRIQANWQQNHGVVGSTVMRFTIL